ncbi:hypothetical protein HAX54_036443 [Datura stramonium]|uniref:Transmembrane protein n=1 Tax=Datura stramonium TaxID=4076 RepID=A0ABS8SGG4_DATST|nr:hypothetical protein [Datura stramonium]
MTFWLTPLASLLKSNKDLSWPSLPPPSVLPLSGTVLFFFVFLGVARLDVQVLVHGLIIRKNCANKY